MCTAITLRSSDGSIVYARTMEFGVPLQSEILVCPRKLSYQGTSPYPDRPGLRWEGKYGLVGANFSKSDWIVDGLNEAGLSVGMLYFPDFAGYQAVGEHNGDAARSIGAWQVGSYLLSTCAAVDEADQALKQVLVGDAGFKPWGGFRPPLHYIVHDRTGCCMVFEYLDGKLHSFSNPMGVLTNSPPFDWHVTNLRNYVNLSALNLDSSQLGLIPLGEGSGMLGLPGDFTPPSRFVRAFFFAGNAPPSETAEASVNQAFHLLNQFDLPVGSTRAIYSLGSLTRKHLVSLELELCEYTEWTSACDLAGGSFFIHTYGNRQVIQVCLADYDLDANEVTTIAAPGSEVPYGPYLGLRPPRRTT